MNHLTVLRLYFSATIAQNSGPWWKRLAPQSLGEHLLRQAKHSGVEQAVLHKIVGGYLRGHSLAIDNGEIRPARMPQCLELIGEEQLLRRFLNDNEDHLSNVRALFLYGTDAHDRSVGTDKTSK